MENIKQTKLAEEGTEPVQAMQELKKQAIENMSIKEGLDNVVTKKEIVKEDKIKKEEETKTLKEKILSMFKTKTIAEMTDPNKLREMVKNDSKALVTIGEFSTGLGGLGNMSERGAKYEEFIKKYNMEDDEGFKKMVNDINLFKKELDGMPKGPDKVNKQKEFNRMHFQFTGKLNEIVEKRIQELG